MKAKWLVIVFFTLMIGWNVMPVFAECNLRPDDISDIEDAIEDFDEAWGKVNEGNIGFYSNYADPKGQAKWRNHLNSWEPKRDDARRKLNSEIATAKKYCN